ncbi:MAG: hypothetical protein R3C19_01170 [Planctomycetaceae bacterium]
MDYSGQLIPNDAVGYFCVASDRVRYPIQVVTSGQFRIGSGRDCHLRLGEGSIPEFLCVVDAADRCARLECSSGSPAVLINGIPATSASLHDGDLIEVESYRLLFRLLSEDTRITLDELHFAPEEQIAPDQPNAARLVDLLQQELTLIEEHERTKSDAVAELLAAAEREGDEAHFAKAAELPTDLSASEALLHVIEILNRQQEASRIRMESVTEVLNNVVRQQQAVADTLQVLSERIVALEAGREFVQRRASA